MLLTENLLITSCYYSPRRELDDAFPDYLEGIGRAMDRTQARHQLIAGDFIAAAAEWGSAQTDARGNELLEWSATRDVCNDGLAPTFLCGERSSFIDVTLATPRIVRGWNVNETESQSVVDHQHVEFEMDLGYGTPEEASDEPPARWKEKIWTCRSFRRPLRVSDDQHGF